MAGQIPKIEEDAQLTTDTSANKITTQPAAGSIISGIGDAISNIADQYGKAALLGETTRAQNALSLKTGQLTQQAGQDQDLSPARHQYYTDQLQQAVTDSQKFITLPSAKNQFANEAGNTVNIASLKISAIRTKKYIDLNKGELETFQQNQETNYLNAVSPAEKQQASLESDRKFQEAYEGGYMTSKQMEAAKIKRNQTWDMNQAMLDQHADADKTIKDLQLGDSGPYKNLLPRQREQAITSVIEFKKKTQVEGQELTAIARNNTEASLLEKHFDNQLTVKEVDDLHAQKQISDSFAESMIKNLNEPVVVPKGVEKFKGYQDVVNKIADPKNSLAEVNNIILDGLQKKNLTVDEAKQLWGATMVDEDGQKISVSKMIQESRGKKPVDIITQRDKMQAQINKNQSWWQAALNTIDSWGKKNDKTPEDQAQVKADFFKQIAANNKKPDQALSVARDLINKDNTKVNPYVAKASDKGTIMQDSKGHKARVFSDGRYEEID